ncbi:hypothetical protein pb186bvf_018688 [Paramecium bursaria]
MDYWYSSYDNESFERDFSKVSYNDILAQVVSHPDFTLLPDQPIKSNEKTLRSLQDALLQFREVLTNYFSAIRENQRDYFGRWVRLVLGFCDCEKMYAILFWSINIPGFLECRLFASLVRAYKFLLSFTQNIIQLKIIQQGDGNKMSYIIRALEKQNGLYFKLDSLLELQVQLQKVFKPLVSHNPTLIGKIYYFIYHMYDKPIQQLKKELDQQYGQLEINWVNKILQENQASIKMLDSMLDDQSKQDADHFVFEESEVIKSLVKQTDQKYDLYRINPSDNSLLEKTKKQQVLEMFEAKTKHQSNKQNSSLVQNFNTQNKFKIINDRQINIMDFSSNQSLVSAAGDTFRPSSTQFSDHLKQSAISFLLQDVIQQPKCNKVQPQSSVKGVPQSNILISDDLVNYITNADTKLVEIRDEDIIFEENNKKKKFRNQRRYIQQGDDDSPEHAQMRKQTSVLQVDHHEDDKRKKINDQVDKKFEQLKMINIMEQEGQVKDSDLFDNLMDDSAESSDGGSPNKKIKHTPFMEDIVFQKLQINMGNSNLYSQIRKKNIVKKLYYMDECSLPMIVNPMDRDPITPDFDDRKWELYRQVWIPNLTKERFISEIKDYIQGYQDSNYYIPTLNQRQTKFQTDQHQLL